MFRSYPAAALRELAGSRIHFFKMRNEVSGRDLVAARFDRGPAHAAGSWRLRKRDGCDFLPRAVFWG